MPLVKYIGHMISAQSISHDHNKVRAIVDLPIPYDTRDLYRFIGMANYLSKFLLSLLRYTHLLRDLMKDGITWCPTSTHDASLCCCKELIMPAPVLHLFNFAASKCARGPYGPRKV